MKGKFVKWVNVDRPGYLGKHRDEKFKEWDTKYGKGNWRLGWVFGDTQLDFLGACRVYEDAYYEYLKQHPEIVDQLVAEASDVYDDELSNVGCGIKYLAQETKRTHVQDIAIRNCLVRMGRRFAGKELIRIRQEMGNHPLSMTLSPGRVPFHEPNMIIQPSACPKWAAPGSVEDFYQSNRYLQAIECERKDKSPCNGPVDQYCLDKLVGVDLNSDAAFIALCKDHAEDHTDVFVSSGGYLMTRGMWESLHQEFPKD
ncbi:MAG: hypothetical protein Q8L24_02745 [bacterium]|nr:hypothetical protein [bacterium]